jgi:hypothetical protein
MDFDIVQILENPAAFVAALVALVAFSRKHFLKNLDGNLVILFTVGIALGLRFLVPLLEPGLVNSIVGTIIAALTASGGVDASRSLLKRTSDGSGLAMNLISSSMQEDIWKTPVGIFVVGLVSKIIPAPLLPIALSIVKPIVKDNAFLDLTTGLQKKLTAEVHRVLRGAGLIKSVSISKSMVSLFSIVALTFVLAGCDLPAVTAGVGNQVAADGATLTYTQTGVTFDPGMSDAQNVVIDIQGEGIITDEAGCTHEAFSVSCTSQLVTEDNSWSLVFSCDACSAFATFFRDDLVPHSVFPQ